MLWVHNYATNMTTTSLYHSSAYSALTKEATNIILPSRLQMYTHVTDRECAVWHGHVKAGFLSNKERVGEALLLHVLQGQLKKFYYVLM
jgi:hypothetical protein